MARWAVRIIELQLTDETFAAPRFDVDRHIRQSYGIFKSDCERCEVTLKFDPTWPAFVGCMFLVPRAARRKHPGRRPTPDHPGGRFHREITMRILSFGRHVEVLAPDELRRRVADEVGVMRRN